MIRRINLFAILLILTCSGYFLRAEDKTATAFVHYDPDNLKLYEQVQDLIPVFVQTIIPLNGIYPEDSRRFTNEIKRTLYDHSAFELRDLSETSKNIWSNEKLGSCEEKACLVELGNLLHVDKILQGKVGKFGKNYSLSLVVFDVKKGEFQSTISRGCKCKEPDFIGVLKKSALELMTKAP